MCRREVRSAVDVLKIGVLELDVGGRRILVNGKRIDLQHREFMLLEVLMRHSDQVVTRSMLLEATWPYDFEPRGNIVDMHIHRLRQKLETALQTLLIHTVSGIGYSLKSSFT